MVNKKKISIATEKMIDLQKELELTKRKLARALKADALKQQKIIDLEKKVAKLERTKEYQKQHIAKQKATIKSVKIDIKQLKIDKDKTAFGKPHMSREEYAALSKTNWTNQFINRIDTYYTGAFTDEQLANMKLRLMSMSNKQIYEFMKEHNLSHTNYDSDGSYTAQELEQYEPAELYNIIIASDGFEGED